MLEGLREKNSLVSSWPVIKCSMFEGLWETKLPCGQSLSANYYMAIARSDWLQDLARWSYLARSELPTRKVSPKSI